MRDLIIDLLDSLDRAVSVCASVPGLLPEGVGETASRVRARLHLAELTVVAALAGGTGSGKSSLLNALAGEELSETGPLRPTTDRALAALADEGEPGLVVLLEQLGIERAAAPGLPEQVALIDLPDTDSVVGAHREMVEQLFPHLDLVIWVVDPEKYRDRVWHDHWLRPHADLQDRFRFVLNQADRLSSSELVDVTIDLRSSLEEDGIAAPRVWITAADPPSGPPVGAEEVMSELHSLAAAKRSALDRMLVDLEQAGRLLAVAVSPVLDREKEAEAVAETAGLLAAERREEAGARLQRHLAELADRFPELEGLEAGALIPDPLPRRWWWPFRRRPRAAEAAEIIRRRLQTEMTTRLRNRGAARAAVAAFLLDLQSARRRLLAGSAP